MKLLLLTQYYPPEIGAPQNRLHELAVRLMQNGIHVDVLTAQPNYPKMEIFEAYKGNKINEEVIDGIRVYRAGIYVSKSKGIIARLLNYFSFVWTSFWRGRKLGNYDFILVESPPLFLGYSAIALSKKLRAKLIFNVSDLWPESAEKLGIVTNKLLLKFAYNLERQCYKKATLVTGQTMGIVDDIRNRFPEKDVYWLPNGVDPSFYNPDNFNGLDFRRRNNFQPNELLFFYGGILGHAQGLEVILHAAKELSAETHIHFILQGAGPEKERLMQLKEQLNIKNVHFLDPVSKNEMPEILKSVDVALVPLKNLPLFQGAIPSKIFEALAMKKPLLLGVDGEAKVHFVDRANAGLFFQPENVSDLVTQIQKLDKNKDAIDEMGERARAYVCEYFDRDKIAMAFMNKLQNI